MREKGREERCEGVMGRRVLRSYARRQGRSFRETREERYQRDLSCFLLPRFGEGREKTLLGREDIWRDVREGDRTVLEVGFGSGEQMVSRFFGEERVMILGCEVYKNGIASCLSHVRRVLCARERGESESVDMERVSGCFRIFAEDVWLLLPYVGEGVCDEVSILFPDPWRKKRHHKRRLVNEGFAREIGRVLSEGGEVRMASDDKEVMKWMEEVWEGEGWKRLDGGGSLGVDFPKNWVKTRYQEKGEREGRESYFACYGL